MRLPERADVLDAAMRIAGYAHRTPVLHSRSLDRLLGASLYFKCENFQRAGAFKFRGACNAVQQLAPDALERGVATHSSGNHAAALALAASERGARATIVMPEDAPEAKKRAVAGYGAEIVLCEPNLQSREETLAHVIGRSGSHLVHPYDDEDVIAGQGTAALELVQEVSDLDVVITPVGGGGLLGGSACALSGQGHRIRLLGAEPKAADDAFRSLASGRLVALEHTDTIADGLRTSLGKRNFALLKRHSVEIATVEEHTIIEAMRLLWERMKIVVEPSAAVAMAPLLEQPGELSRARIGIILSGGNLDLDRLPWQTS